MIRKQLHALTQWFSSTVGPAVLQATLPATCAGCGRAGAWICDRCERHIRPDDSPGCQRCGRTGPSRQQCARCRSVFPSSLRKVRVGFSYDGPMRRAVHRFKYHGEYQRGYELGERLGGRFHEVLPDACVDVIVPVPLHPRRYRARGFNQAGILAEAVSTVLDVPVAHAVRRVRNTTPQVRLSASRRLSNLIDAFELEPREEHYLVGKRVLIVDDVTTTGATLSAVASAFQPAGDIEVFGLALAREQ